MGLRAAPEPARHAGLDRAQVVDCALDLVESHGAEALSMRKLAAGLGVTTNTIYWHVGSHDELVIALITRLAEQQAQAEIQGSTARDRVASAARNIWLNALAHRNVTALARQAGATTLLELPLEVALVAELETAGVHGDQARDTLRSILMLIAGFLVGAWRRDHLAPEALRPSTLWNTVADPRIDASTIAALSEPPGLGDLILEMAPATVSLLFLSMEGLRVRYCYVKTYLY